jgi:hypothetical protein
MTSKLVLTKKDPRRTSFVSAGDRGTPVYASSTTYHPRPRNGSRATTTVTRIDPSGDRFQVGIIEWPVHPHDNQPLVVGTRTVRMSKLGIFTSWVAFLRSRPG